MWYHVAMNSTAQTNDDQVKQNQPAQPFQQPVQPAQPVGSVQKETGHVSDFVKPTEHAPKISPELRKAGVEESPNHEVPKLSLEDKKAGLGLAKEHTPVVTQPTGSVKLPMTGQQAKLALHKKISDSMRWLALLVLRQLKKQTIGKL